MSIRNRIPLLYSVVEIIIIIEVTDIYLLRLSYFYLYSVKD